MKITVKVLQGKQCTLEVDSSMTVLDVKEMISESLKIPVSQQKLLFTGRPLLDEKQLSEYPGITDGARLNLVVSRSLGANNSAASGNHASLSPVSSVPLLSDTTYRFLCRYYCDVDSRRIADEFMKEFNRSVSSLSLDDIERIAALYLDDEVAV